MTEQNLAQYGAIGVMLMVLLGLFVWVFKLMITRLLEHLQKFEVFMTNSITVQSEVSQALKALRESIETRQSVRTSRMG